MNQNLHPKSYIDQFQIFKLTAAPEKSRTGLLKMKGNNVYAVVVVPVCCLADFIHASIAGPQGLFFFAAAAGNQQFCTMNPPPPRKNNVCVLTAAKPKC